MLLGEGVQQPRAGKEGVVAGGEHAGEDDGVDDAAGGLGAGHLEDDGEGRGAGVFLVEVRVVVGYVEADDEDGEDTALCQWALKGEG